MKITIRCFDPWHSSRELTINITLVMTKVYVQRKQVKRAYYNVRNAMHNLSNLNQNEIFPHK